ncbi:hypothetical protein [Spirillospora sp. CA-294931]|uniref:hypothetical protein n=1 Tax=Spirillospora sp. CA-294931 TaxID=3240042 RepID=UPI003D900F46
MTHPATRASGALLAAVTVLSLAGCGSDGSKATSKPTASRTSAAPSSSAPPPTSASPVPTAAADGTRLRACTDGTCEIEVKKGARIPVKPKFGVEQVRVTAVKDKGVSLDMLITGGSFSLACDGDDDCQSFVQGATEYSPGMARATGHPGAKISINKIVISVLAVSGKSAILGIKPA